MLYRLLECDTYLAVALKRTYLPRRASLKRKTIKRPSKKKKRSRAKLTPLKKLKKELWELCRKITAKRYPDVCFTCGKSISGSNRQLGHFIPRSVGGTLLKYHLDNLRWQCYYDNINLGGNGSEFYRRLVNEIGLERVEGLFELKKQVAKATVPFYQQLISEYSVILDSYGETEERTT